LDSLRRGGERNSNRKQISLSLKMWVSEEERSRDTKRKHHGAIGKIREAVKRKKKRRGKGFPTKSSGVKKGPKRGKL